MIDGKRSSIDGKLQLISIENKVQLMENKLCIELIVNFFFLITTK